jgi:hypothetical protein
MEKLIFILLFSFGVLSFAKPVDCSDALNLKKTQTIRYSLTRFYPAAAGWDNAMINHANANNLKWTLWTTPGFVSKKFTIELTGEYKDLYSFWLWFKNVNQVQD